MGNMENEPNDLASVKTEVAVLKREFETICRDLAEIKKLLENFRNPRPTNWVGICSFALALTMGVGAFVGMFLNMRLTPIEKDVSSLSNEFKSQTQRVDRDLTWNYENQRLHHEHTEKMIDKVWEKVFSQEMPQFKDKPRP